MLLVPPYLSLIIPAAEADPAIIYVPDDHPTIQYAIGNATEGDTIIVRSGTYRESINIYRSLTIQGEDGSTTFIDGMGATSVVFTGSEGVTFRGFTVFNGSQGIQCSNTEGVSIVDCVACNCTVSGIYFWNADSVLIENCTSYGNKFNGIHVRGSSDYARLAGCDSYSNGYHGICVEYSSDYARISECSCYNNSYSGIYVYCSKKAAIWDCDCYNNSDYGIYLSCACTARIGNTDCYDNKDGIRIDSSDIVSNCNGTLHDNSRYGLYSTYSEELYVSRTAIHNNSLDGIHLDYSRGCIVNCNVTDHGDDGMDFENSDVRIRYCSIHDNDDCGVYIPGYGYVDATDNWWGDASGPYHYSENPTGTGDSVFNGVLFDPWQTSLLQPETLISDLRCRILGASENTVYYVPTGNIYDDSTFYAFYNHKDYPQVITAPTQSPESSAYLDGDGSPLFDGDVVTFGGRFANRMVAHFEDAGVAMVGFLNNGTHRVFKRISDGAHLYAVDSSTYNETEKDYFVFQIYRDGERHIFSIWGIRAPGTYAGGTCFIDLMFPNLHEYTDRYCVFSWTDSNNDDMPQRGEIALEASGI